MSVRRITDTVDRIESFGDGILLVDSAARAVKLGKIRRDQNPAGVVPRAISNPVARAHGRLRPGCHRAQIRAPRVVTCAFGFRESLAVRVRSGETAKVSALAHPHAGDEKSGH